MDDPQHTRPRCVNHLAVLICLFAAAVANAGILDSPIAHSPLVEDIQSETPFQYWTRLAKGGSARAQLQLAQMYASGEGTTQDDGEALKWFTLAAEGGFAEAQYA